MTSIAAGGDPQSLPLPSSVEAKPQAHLDWGGLVCLLIVYVGWSGTYLAIRVAVQDGSGFPPLAMAGTRFLAAAFLVMVLAAVARERLRPTRSELLVLAGIGCLTLVGGNGLVTLAEQRAGSGIAAVLVATTPVWVAVVSAIIDRRRPSWLLIGGLAAGFAGVAILAWPLLSTGVRADLLAVLALIGAPLSWSIGSIVHARRPDSMGPFTSSGYQQITGALVALSVAGLIREPLPQPTSNAWWGWGYLVVIGSVVTFTAYMQALRRLPTHLAATYAYVNPVGALFLGWLLLAEPMTLSTLAGSILVLIGITGVFRDQWR